jgi:GT2 family glycosyltransferase
MPSSPIVSIIVPTFNRLARLRRCLDAIAQNVRIDHEVIVVDGGSTDGSREHLRERSEVRAILESVREGAVKAFNKGFRAATSTYVTWLNDDAWPLAGSVEAAVAMLERPDLRDVGMVAFYHTWHSERNILDQVTYEEVTYCMCHVRGYPYANFGLLRRELLARVGFADEGYRFFGFDPDLSLKIQRDAGLRVVGCRRALIVHEEWHDERKLGDLPSGTEDNVRLFAKWNLPPPGGYPDPVPEYQRLRAERGLD